MDFEKNHISIKNLKGYYRSVKDEYEREPYGKWSSWVGDVKDTASEASFTADISIDNFNLGKCTIDCTIRYDIEHMHEPREEILGTIIDTPVNCVYMRTDDGKFVDLDGEGYDQIPEDLRRIYDDYFMDTVYEAVKRYVDSNNEQLIVPLSERKETNRKTSLVEAFFNSKKKQFADCKKVDETFHINIVSSSPYNDAKSYMSDLLNNFNVGDEKSYNQTFVNNNIELAADIMMNDQLLKHVTLITDLVYTGSVMEPYGMLTKFEATVTLDKVENTHIIDENGHTIDMQEIEMSIPSRSLRMLFDKYFDRLVYDGVRDFFSTDETVWAEKFMPEGL